MSSKTDIAGLIKQIHQSSLKLVIVSSGGGTNAIASISKFQEPPKLFLRATFLMQESHWLITCLKNPISIVLWTQL